MSEFPRPIEFEDIRVGDRVRRTIRHAGGSVTVIEGTVTNRTVSQIILGSKDVDDTAAHIFPAGWYELLSRPKPEFKPGQVWRCQASGDRYVTFHDSGRDANQVAEIRFVNAETGLSCSQYFPDTRLVYVGEAEIGVKGLHAETSDPEALRAKIIDAIEDRIGGPKNVGIHADGMREALAYVRMVKA